MADSFSSLRVQLTGPPSNSSPPKSPSETASEPPCITPLQFSAQLLLLFDLSYSWVHLLNFPSRPIRYELQRRTHSLFLRMAVRMSLLWMSKQKLQVFSYYYVHMVQANMLPAPRTLLGTERALNGSQQNGWLSWESVRAFISKGAGQLPAQTD